MASDNHAYNPRSGSEERTVFNQDDEKQNLEWLDPVQEFNEDNERLRAIIKATRRDLKD